MNHVFSGTIGVIKVAHNHGVLLTTLKDRISGRVQHGTISGPKCYLNEEEEGEVAVFLKDCASVGCGRTKREIMSIAESVADWRGIKRKEKMALCPEPFTNYTSEDSVPYQHILLEDDFDDRTAVPKEVWSSFLSSLQ